MPKCLWQLLTASYFYHTFPAHNIRTVWLHINYSHQLLLHLTHNKYYQEYSNKGSKLLYLIVDRKERQGFGGEPPPPPPNALE